MGRSEDDRPRSEEPRKVDVVVFGDHPVGSVRWSRRWRRWIPVAVAIAVAAGFVVNATRGDRPSVTPTPTETRVADPSRPAGPTSAGPAPSEPTVTAVGRPILGITAAWELFAHGREGLVRIEFAAGRVTLTPLPPLLTTGPAFLIVGDHWAVVRPLDRVPGYLVPDGKPATELTGLLTQGGVALPGPKHTGVWVSPDAAPTGMTLVSPQGTRLGPSITVPRDAEGVVASDGTGYVVAGTARGAYELRPDKPRRITNVMLLAVGPTRWLVSDCDIDPGCRATVIDRADGRRHDLGRLGADSAGSPLDGVISPDGATAAIYATDADAVDPTVRIHLVDLSTGAAFPVDVPFGDAMGPMTMAWSPDSRWLFAVGQRRLFAVDAATRHVSNFEFLVPPVDQIAIRPAGV